MRKLLPVAVLLSAMLLVSSSAAPPPAASPDQMAWQVFVALTAPAAKPGVKAVAFETWASDSDIYSTTPPSWPDAPHKQLMRSLAATAEDRAAHGLAAAPPGCLPKDGEAGNFPHGACIGEEVQHNRAAFDTIVANNLYSTAGLKNAFASGKPVAFPNDAIVVKADWVLVGDILRWLPKAYKTADAVRRAYYTNTATLNGQSGEYALAGLSVQSNQMPNWLWMTFEHRSNPGRCDVIGCHDDFGAVPANVTPERDPNADYGPCAKTPALQAMLAGARIDPIWNNYCLKGTQVQFLTPDGRRTLLANSVIERMNKGVCVEKTSCITCHAYASFDRAGAPNYGALQPPPTGAVRAELLNGYKTYDYMWGLLVAH